MPDVLELLASNMETNENGCFLWLGPFYDGGYGYCNGPYKYKAVHRVAYDALVGPIGSLWVLHTCDTPNCFNPDHLFLGTRKDNVRDMIAKGRAKFNDGPKPEPEYLHLLAEMRALRNQGLSYEKTAKKLNVSKAAVFRYIAKYGLSE